MGAVTKALHRDFPQWEGGASGECWSSGVADGLSFGYVGGAEPPGASSGPKVCNGFDGGVLRAGMIHDDSPRGNGGAE